MQLAFIDLFHFSKVSIRRASRFVARPGFVFVNRPPLCAPVMRDETPAPIFIRLNFRDVFLAMGIFQGSPSLI